MPVRNPFEIDGTTHPQVTASSWDILAVDKPAWNKVRGYRLPHVRPQSILIAAIGNLWEEGAWWRLQDMLLATACAGHSISLQEVKDSSFYSSSAIWMMRWQASMLARDGGVDWLLMVDNDALVEKDTLLRLLAHDRPVVYPLLEDMERRWPRANAPMSDPDIDVDKKGQGLVPVRWAAMSVMLFNPRIFNHLDSAAWHGSDFVFAQALNNLGHRIYVDTDTVVKVVRGPSRLASLEYDDYWTGHRRMWERLRTEERNRKPPPGFNPEKDNGFVDQWGTYFAVLNKTNGAKK